MGVFEANGFPRLAVAKVLSRTRREPPQSAVEDEGEEKKVMFFPYVHGISERIEQVCRPLKIKAVFKSAGTLR